MPLLFFPPEKVGLTDSHAWRELSWPLGALAPSRADENLGQRLQKSWQWERRLERAVPHSIGSAGDPHPKLRSVDQVLFVPSPAVTHWPVPLDQ